MPFLRSRKPKEPPVFIENRLQELLAAIGTNPATRAEFYQSLLAAELTVISKVRGPPGSDSPGRHVAKGVAFEIQTIRSDDGALLTPVFSSPLRASNSWIAKQGLPGDGLTLLRGRNLFQSMRPGEDCVLDPGYPGAKRLYADEIQALLDGSVFSILNEEQKVNRMESFLSPGTKYFVRPAESVPQALAENLTSFGKSTSYVRKLYMAEVWVPGRTTEPELMLGVEPDERAGRPIETIMAYVGQVAKETLGVDVVNLMVVDPEPNGPFTNITPFFVR